MEHALERTVDVDLSASEVWELLVDDEERAAWFGGPTELDAVPGGDAEFTDPDGTRRRAVVDEVAPGRLLSWTWWPEDGDGAMSQVTIELRPLPGGTQVEVTEVPVARASVSSASATHVPVLELELRCLLRTGMRAAA